MRQKKILIVDDNKQILEMYGKKFETSGFEVSKEINGSRGVLAADKIKPDIVLLDIMMPVLDGFESLNILRNERNFCPIIILFSNLEDSTYVKKGLKMGANDYLFKIDHTPGDVLRRANELLNEKSSSIGKSKIYTQFK